MKKLSLCFLMIVLGIALPAQELNSVFWEVKAPNGKTSYLLGTYHLMGGEYINEIPKASEAFAQSRAVMVEMVMDSAAMGRASLLTIMPGRSIKAMSDSLDYSLLKKKLEPLFGMDLINLDMLKPVVLSTQYALELAKKNTPEEAKFPGAPLDLHLASQAKKENKELLALETVEEQMKILFNSQSPEEQLQDLITIVKDSLNTETSTKKLIENYLAGNLSKMYSNALEFEESMGDMDVLLKDRNLAWLPKIEEEMQKGGLFIAVGALHLPGENGIIKELKNKGYIFKAL